jgi:quercetin 2,3-dioxygenase
MIDVRRGAERFHTSLDWLDSWHSFSFGEHHDPGNTGHGLLVVSNDDRVSPGRGFGTHPHRDMEIVTWVLEGALEHRDSAGNQGTITPGVAQRMSAGSGVTHSEQNPSAHEPVRLVQMWVRPDRRGGEPSYEQRDLGADLDGGGLVPVASGQGHPGAVSLQQPGAVLWAGRLRAGASVDLPVAPHVHVFVAVGSADLAGGGPLAEGDAVRLADAGPLALAAGPAGAEILVWEMG